MSSMRRQPVLKTANYTNEALGLRGKSKSSEHQTDSHRQDRSIFYRIWHMKGPRSLDRATTMKETGGFSQHHNYPANEDFQREVVKTSNAQEIGHQEAEMVVYTKRLIREHGTIDKALLCVISEKVTQETQVLGLINNLIHRGADTSAVGEDKKTLLHYAAEKNWKGVATKLLENKASVDRRDKDGKLPLHIAIEKNYDKMGALLLAYMKNSFVRSLFITQDSSKAELSDSSKASKAELSDSSKAELTDPPKVELSDPPKVELSDPPKAELSDPHKAELSDSPKAELSDPPKAELSDPHKAELSDPPKAELSDPPMAELSDPHKAELSDPHKVELSDPHKAELSDPPKVELSDPHKTELSDPPKAELSDPHKDELSDPPKAEFSDPPKAELSDPPNVELSDPPNAKLSDPPKAELSFHKLIRDEMQMTILSLLDCMIEPQGSLDQIRVYYNVLECDERGNTPKDKHFDSTEKSPLQIISKQGNKNILYHDSIRLLVRKKWIEFAGSKFQHNALIYMLTLIALSFSVVVAVMTENPAIYDSPLQIARAVTEVFCLCMIIKTFITELIQLRRHKLEYFTDAFNWFDMSSSVLLLMVPAFRFTNINAQWHIYAFGFLFWVIRIFKFAAVFRQTGAYAQILGRIIVDDFVQFGVVFIVVLLAFSGSFFLSLRGDNDIDLHRETSTFWGILFVGVRTLSEAQPVVEYTGSEGYSTISTIFMVLFLFTCCVILLNILIAQLSDTYQKVQQDAQRGLEVNRAWIVARLELNSFYFIKDFRTDHYKEYEDIPDVREVLTKWDSPPLNEMNKLVTDIWDSLDTRKMNLQIIKQRMVRQEEVLRKMQEQLTLLVELQTGDKKPTERVVEPRPRLYKSNWELAKSAKLKAYYRRSLKPSFPLEEIKEVEATTHKETLKEDVQDSTSHDKAPYHEASSDRNVAFPVYSDNETNI